MKVLIGCEESQTVCQAFRKLGHEAYSCDLVVTRGNPDYHYKADVKDVLTEKSWNLAILHPDCTRLAVCGNSTYGKGMEKHDERLFAIDWTIDLWERAKANSDAVVLENPMSVIFPVLRKAGAVVQYIQPYQFGHLEQKRTGLALHNVEPLIETDNVYEQMMQLPKNQRERVHYMAPGATRKRDRSKTYQGIADAMAEQWG